MRKSSFTTNHFFFYFTNISWAWEVTVAWFCIFIVCVNLDFRTKQVSLSLSVSGYFLFLCLYIWSLDCFDSGSNLWRSKLSECLKYNFVLAEVGPGLGWLMEWVLSGDRLQGHSWEILAQMVIADHLNYIRLIFDNQINPLHHHHKFSAETKCIRHVP